LSPLKETIKETALRVKEKRSGSRTRFHPPSSFANAPSEVAGTREQRLRRQHHLRWEKTATQYATSGFSETEADSETLSVVMQTP